MKDTKKYFKISFTGILIALMFAFSWTVLGMIPLGIASATTVFIPVVIGIICLNDFKYSVVLGFAFGLVSLIRSLSPTGFLDPFFINPIISVVPRVIMAILTHLFYNLLLKCFNKAKYKYEICASLSGGIAALTNTIFTISILLLVHFPEISAELTNSSSTIGLFIKAIVLTNMLPEIILGMIVSFVVIKIYNKIGYLKEDK